MKRHVDKLKEFCKSHKLNLEVTTTIRSGDLGAVFDELAVLHSDYGKIRAVWKHDKKNGGIRVSDPKWIAKLNSDHTNKQYSDEDVLDSGYEVDWWKRNIDVFRNLYQFHEEGNGDGVYVDLRCGKVYFLAHDWMDWISDDPPMFCVGNSIQAFYDEWANIGFAWPIGLYWMNAQKDGKFVGFNAKGFCMV